MTTQRQRTGRRQPQADRERASERLVSVLRDSTRWAGSGGLSQSSGKATGINRGGCANPLNLVKVLVLLALAVCFPLFLLPFVLVWLVRYGRQALGFSAKVDVAAGDSARWGYNQLEPVPEGHNVAAGIASIASHDPGFSVSALTAWATSATDLIRQSVTSGDATPARTFMASGLLRTHQALLELRGKSQVSCEGSWRAVDAKVVRAISTQLVDEVRVRVTCEGWCWEMHDSTRLTLRGDPELQTWVEDFTFGRSAAASTPADGGLPARRCPSCGADLSVDETGACRYCHGVVTAGRLDWVLISWRREPW
jgi:hypothetical protein